MRQDFPLAKNCTQGHLPCTARPHNSKHMTAKRSSHRLPVRLLRTALLALALSFSAQPLAARAADAPKSSPPVYDESLDAEKQIAEAVEQAKKENKNILLQFGANWCGWCHKLHKLFDTDKSISSKLRSDYIVVMVDVNKGHNSATAAKYKAGQQGIPCIVILNSQGGHLTTKETGELEEGDHHSPQKVLAFLNQWAPRKA